MSLFQGNDVYKPTGALPRKAVKQVVPQYQPTDFSVSDSFKLYKPILKEAKQSEVQVYESGVYWEFPDVPFRSIYEYYKKDPGIQSSVNSYREQIIGSGFYFTSDDQKVLDFLNEWSTEIDFEQKLRICVSDSLMLGCSLGEIVKSAGYIDIVPVDMRSIVAVQRDKFGAIEHYIQQTLQQTFNKLEPKNFIKFSNIEVGRMAWPIGIFHSLVVPFFEFEGEPWSLADVDALMRQDYARIIHKMAAPRSWHVYENANEEKLKEQALKDKTMKPGERGYTDSKFEIMQEGIDKTAAFKDYIEFLTNAKENGMQAPTAKLMTATGISNATYASADAAREMFEKHILGFQRKWQAQIEQQIIKPLLAANGMDMAKSKARFNWGMQDPPEVEVETILALVGAGIMSIPEAREVLKDYARLPLKAEYTQQAQDEMKQKLDTANKQLKNAEALIKLAEKKSKKSSLSTKTASDSK